MGMCTVREEISFMNTFKPLRSNERNVLQIRIRLGFRLVWPTSDLFEESAENLVSRLTITTCCRLLPFDEFSTMIGRKLIADAPAWRSQCEFNEFITRSKPSSWLWTWNVARCRVIDLNETPKRPQKHSGESGAGKADELMWFWPCLALGCCCFFV